MRLKLLTSISLITMCLATSGALATPVDFSYSGSIVDYTIPTTGVYHVTVAGAQGGSIYYVSGASGGLGAEIGGDLTLTAGQTLEIAVGGQGDLGGQTCFFCVLGDSPGGGGGSFVVLKSGSTFVPFVIAGGGGGAGYGGGYFGTGYAGGAGQAGPGGSDAFANCGGAGGSAGNGGGVGSESCVGASPDSLAGAGAGFSTNGASADSGSGNGGQSFLNGLAGGGESANLGGAGGFGGAGSGGGEFGGDGGGGGGYSGGGGGGISNAGGGGGSYFTDLTALSPDELLAQSGANSGNGYVSLDLVSTAVPEPSSLALVGAGVLVFAAMRRRKRKSA